MLLNAEYNKVRFVVVSRKYKIRFCFFIQILTYKAILSREFMINNSNLKFRTVYK